MPRSGTVYLLQKPVRGITPNILLLIIVQNNSTKNLYHLHASAIDLTPLPKPLPLGLEEVNSKISTKLLEIALIIMDPDSSATDIIKNKRASFSISFEIPYRFVFVHRPSPLVHYPISLIGKNNQNKVSLHNIIYMCTVCLYCT